MNLSKNKKKNRGLRLSYFFLLSTALSLLSICSFSFFSSNTIAQTLPQTKNVLNQQVFGSYRDHQLVIRGTVATDFDFIFNLDIVQEANNEKFVVLDCQSFLQGLIVHNIATADAANAEDEDQRDFFLLEGQECTDLLNTIFEAKIKNNVTCLDINDYRMIFSTKAAAEECFQN